MRAKDVLNTAIAIVVFPFLVAVVLFFYIVACLFAIAQIVLAHVFRIVAPIRRSASRRTDRRRRRRHSQ